MNIQNRNAKILFYTRTFGIFQTEASALVWNIVTVDSSDKITISAVVESNFYARDTNWTANQCPYIRTV